MLIRKLVPLGHDLALLSLETYERADIKLDAPVWLWDERLRYRLLYNNPTAVRHYISNCADLNNASRRLTGRM